MIEIYKQNPKSFIHHGDSAETMDLWQKNYGEKVDLIYIDPPPSSGFSFKLIQKAGINQGRIAHSEPISESRGRNEYMSMMEKVFQKSKALLKSTGNIFVHCSPRMSASFKSVLDSVFGTGNFVNEIIYKYDHSANSLHHFSLSHDTILFYRKSGSGYFDPKPTAKTRGTERRHHMKKNTDKDGRVYFSIVIDGKEYRYYEDDLIYMGDVWSDIEEVFESDRVKYEGQKPIELLKRIIISACPEKGLVCDPFCGAGTSGAAAAELGCEFLMCDSSHFAVNISKNTLSQLDRPFGVVWGDFDIYGERPEIRFSYKGMKVHLDEYRVRGGEKYYSNDLIPTEDTLVESWSVGRLLGDKYYVDDFDLRTHKKPALGRHLSLKPEDGKPVSVTFDALGNQLMHRLDISKA